MIKKAKVEAKVMAVAMAEAPLPAPVPLPEGLSRYFNRELSWLKFNGRVLEEAQNANHPLLERLRFLSISGGNLDEFFMVRIAGLRGQQIQQIEEPSIDGLTPAQQLEAATADADALMAAQQELWAKMRTELAGEQIEVLDAGSISRQESVELETHFRDEIYPVLTLQALDPAHPFPFVPNLGLSIIFDLRRLSDDEPIRELIMLPATLQRFQRLPGKAARYVTIETVLRHFAPILFPGYEILGSAAFRIIRDSDIEVEEEAEDLVRYFRSAIKRRRRGRVIRLEVEQAMPDELEQLIRRELGGGDTIISETASFLGIADLAQLVEEDRPDLKFPPFTPRFPERIREHDGDCFAAIRQKDLVVHHPYESFDVVLAFIKQAAADPDVVAIKQMLYRAGKQSAIVRALCDAAEQLNRQAQFLDPREKLRAIRRIAHCRRRCDAQAIDMHQLYQRAKPGKRSQRCLCSVRVQRAGGDHPAAQFRREFLIIKNNRRTRRSAENDEADRVRPNINDGASFTVAHLLRFNRSFGTLPAMSAAPRPDNDGLVMK